MTPTSRGLALLLLAVALLVPLALGAATWVARRGAPTGRRAATAAGVVVAVLAAQVALVGSSAVLVNGALGLYPTWADVQALADDGGDVGADIPNNAPQQITDAQARQIASVGWAPYRKQPPAGDGQYRLYLVPSPSNHSRLPVVVWVPPGHEHAKTLAGLRTVYLYNAAYGSVDWFMGAVDPARSAAPLVRAKKVAPFVVVAPEINVDAPGDTECTDYPHGGPQAFTWLVTDVPDWAHRTLGLTTDAAHASAVGWSVGGYCAAKAHAALPHRFGAAASMEGFFASEADATTGALVTDLRADPKLRARTDVSWLIAQQRPRPTLHLLVMTSKADPQSYPASAAFLRAHARTPGVWSCVDEHAGHSVPGWRAVQPELWRFLVARTPWPKALATP